MSQEKLNGPSQKATNEQNEKFGAEEKQNQKKEEERKEEKRNG